MKEQDAMYGRKPILKAGLIGFALIAAGAAPAFAEAMSFQASLKPAEEVPPAKSKGIGAATVTYDTASRKLTWKITYSDLSGPATMAHFHGPADPGKNAGVAVPITALASPMEGSATLTEAQAAELMAGKLYVNIHTAENKAGEIRGQVKKAE